MGLIPKKLSNLKFCRVLKSTKKPFEKNWVNKPYSYEEIERYIKKGENYGVLCGYENLIVIDADVPELAEAVSKLLPPSFRVETGSGGIHDYYICNDLNKKIVLTKNNKHYGEIQAKGTQVVGVGSLHPNGKKYKVLRDVSLKEISKDDLMKCIKPFTKEVETEETKVLFNLRDYGNSDINSINISSIINTTGFKKGTNGEYYGSSPFHGSSTGMNTWINNSKNVAYCFRCNCGINVAQAIGLTEGIILNCSDKLSRSQFLEVLKIAQDKYGLEKPKMKESSKIEGGIMELQTKVFEALLSRRREDVSELLTNFFEKENNIYTTKNDLRTEMWIYHKGIYLPQGKSEVKEFCRIILKKYFTMRIFNEVVNKIETDTYIDEKEFFNNNYIDEIPLENGILNVKTREITPFTPKKIFFSKICIKYNPETKCPNIDKFFKEVLKNEEDVITMYEVIGFILYKDYFIEKALMFNGGGRNGKGKTIELIKRFCGANNCSSVPLSQLHSNSTSVSNLFGKYANLAGDLSRTALKDTGCFKETTGRDTITSKRKYLSDLEFTNYAVHIFACNELPMIYDMTKGFWDRWVLFDFPYTFVDEREYQGLSDDDKKNHKIRDPFVIEQISSPNELSGLLNKALDGLDRLFKNKDFSKSEGTEELKKRWIRKSSSFISFILDNIEENYNSKISKKILRRSYSLYCRKHKISGASDKAIKVILQEEFGATETRDSYDTRDRIWEGIGFKKNSEYN